MLFSSTFRRDAPFGNEICVPKYLTTCSFRIYVAMGIYLQNPRRSCLFFHIPSVAQSGGRRPLEMKYTFSNTRSRVVSEYIWLWGLSPKLLEWLLVFSFTFSSTFRRKAPFGNEIYISKYPESCSFRIYMVLGVYLRNSRNGWLLFPAPSGERCP